ETIPYLAVPVSDFPYNSDQFTGIAILTIDLLKFQSSLLADQPASEFQICILDREGTVICHSNASLIGLNLRDETWVDQAFSDRQRFFSEVNGKRYELQTTGLSKNGFAIVVMSEYAAQAGSISKTANIIIFAVIIAAALQICLTMIVSRRIFTPLTSIVAQMQQSGTTAGAEIPDSNGDEVMFLQQYNNAVSDRIHQLVQNRNRDFIAKNLILGIHQQDIQQLLLQNRTILPDRPYYMILVAVENRNAEEETMHGYDLLRSMTAHSLQDALSQFGQCSYYEIGLKRSLFFLCTDSTDATAELDRTLSEVNADLSRTFAVRIHAAFSGAAQDSGWDCTDRYRQLSESLKTALILNRTAEQADSTAVLDTPDSSAVINAVKAHDHDAFHSAVSTWLKALPCAPYSKIAPVLSELGSSIVRAGGLPPKAAGNDLDTIVTYDELLSWLEDLYQKSVSQKAGSAKRTTTILMEEAVDYIRNNPEDSNLNVNMLADRLHITPAYFGKLFQEFTGSRTLDYILQVRMERAKTLLLTELHMDISEIACQTGYNNSTYFTTAFKKYYGMTPSKYRESYVETAKKANKETQ
ncbi:MAG: AraC family transcriptional regulator, partial [Clostridia bacterium]|nr:AraC family transcriptional regulator [Clostridia bacterium]